jgi:hypothetical protein
MESTMDRRQTGRMANALINLDAALESFDECVEPAHRHASQ